MSINYTKNIKAFNGKPIHVERFNSADEVAAVSQNRQITDGQFHNREKYCPFDFTGVHSMDEARNLLRYGYEPTVEKLKQSVKAGISGEKKRISFHNDVVGFAPVVPLALMGVPCSMVNSYMRPIKAKVINVVYEMTAHADVKSDELIKAGQLFLGTLLDLEAQGYKFNIYAAQSYWDGKSADTLLVRIKDSRTPLDLKRMSFPMTHTAFFRAIGFDWYSKTPGGRYRFGYGHSLSVDFSEARVTDGYTELVGEKCVVFCADRILSKGEEHIRNVVTNDRVQKEG